MRVIIFSSLILFSLTACDLPKPSHGKDGDVSAKAAPNYKAIDRWILTTRCVECHGPAKQSNKIDLSTYEKIMDKKIWPPLVVPGNPEESSLYTSVAKGTMPKDGSPLRPRELRAIYDWIKNGAKKEEMPETQPTPQPQPQPEPGGEEPGEPGGGGSDEPGRQRSDSDEPGTAGSSEKDEPGN